MNAMISKSQICAPQVGRRPTCGGILSTQCCVLILYFLTKYFCLIHKLEEVVVVAVLAQNVLYQCDPKYARYMCNCWHILHDSQARTLTAIVGTSSASGRNCRRERTMKTKVCMFWFVSYTLACVVRPGTSATAGTIVAASPECSASWSGSLWPHVEPTHACA